MPVDAARDELEHRSRARPPAPRHLLPGHGDAVTGLVVEPDGRLLSVDTSGGTGAWDPVTGAPARTDPVAGPYGPGAVHLPRPRAIATSPDGGLVAVAGSDGVVRVLAGAGPEVAAFDAAGVTVLTFAATPAGATLLAGAGGDGTVRIWNVITGAPLAVAAGHGGPVRALAVTGPGTVVSGCADGALRTWDVTSGDLLAMLEGDSPVVGIAPTGPEELLVATADGAVHLLELTTGVPHDPVVLDDSGAGAGAAVPAGHGCALVTREDGTVELWRAGADAGPAVLTGHGAPVRAAAASADGTVLATGDDDGRILVWDPAPVGAGTIPEQARGTGNAIPAPRHAADPEPAAGLLRA